MTDQLQQVVWRANYEPFGEANITVNTVTNNLRFPGQYFDQETNLHYYYFRYYDPATGRHITSDPIGLLGGINTYIYALNSPIRFMDEKGLVAWKVRDTFVLSGAIGLGGAFHFYELESPCVDGFKFIINVVAVGPAVGGGISCKFCFTAPAKVPFPRKGFEDGSSKPNPQAFNGVFASGSLSVQALGFGGERGDTSLGWAISIDKYTPAVGMGTIGLEAIGAVGTSTVLGIKKENCCE